MVVEVDRPKDWELPDDGRRVFPGEERIPIAERPVSMTPNLSPWLTAAPPEGMNSRPSPPPSRVEPRGGPFSTAFWLSEFGGPSPGR